MQTNSFTVSTKFIANTINFQIQNHKAFNGRLWDVLHGDVLPLQNQNTSHSAG